MAKHFKTSSQVQAVCDWFGPTDRQQLADTSFNPRISPRLHKADGNEAARCTSGADQDRAKLANPITFVSPKRRHS